VPDKVLTSIKRPEETPSGAAGEKKNIPLLSAFIFNSIYLEVCHSTGRHLSTFHG
jgi:hypothetical protein